MPGDIFDGGFQDVHHLLPRRLGGEIQSNIWRTQGLDGQTKPVKPKRACRLQVANTLQRNFKFVI
jgi:hypothetical protein